LLNCKERNMKLENNDNDKNYMLIVMDLNDGSWKYSIH
jgi:hypothetical protein